MDGKVEGDGGRMDGNGRGGRMDGKGRVEEEWMGRV